MATTDIHAITQTVARSISYIMSDKHESVLKDDVADSIHYVVSDKTGEVTYRTLTTTLNCSNTENPVEDFYALMNTYGAHELKYGSSKTKDKNPVVAWHLIQGFEGQEVDPVTANEIGRKLAQELFGNFPVVISTHTNTENIHNHIEFCAWDLDGKKYNYNHEAYQKIRETSDRLCEEYGLPVIEHTRERKLVKWKDSEGGTHYYEPTDRKNEMIRQRQANKLSQDDVNSYRNTVQYDISEAKKETRAAIVKEAIDSMLPYAVSYEHLLFMLREEGFKISDKKKNGEWLAHITFTPPTSERGVRDYKIDESGYYTRENLSLVIAEQNKERNRNEKDNSNLTLPYYDEYVYGEFDVQKINEDYRAEVSEIGEYKIVRRGEPEKTIIRDIKQSDRELYGLFDTTTLNKLIEEQRREQAKKIKKPTQKREEILIRQIQEGFENLRFIERKQIYSNQQVKDIIKSLYVQRDACEEKIKEAETMIERLESVANTPKVLIEIRDRMKEGKDNPEYMAEQYHKDLKLMKSSVADLQKYNVADAEGLKSLQVSIQKYREQVYSLQDKVLEFSKELSDYNRCVNTLDRIERNRVQRQKEQQLVYENMIRDRQEQDEQEKDENKKEKERDR